MEEYSALVVPAGCNNIHLSQIAMEFVFSSASWIDTCFDVTAYLSSLELPKAQLLVCRLPRQVVIDTSQEECVVNFMVISQYLCPHSWKF